MPRLTIDEFARMRDALSALRDDFSLHVEEVGPTPAPKSRGAEDIRTFARAESVHTAHSQASILVEVAADQLTAFVKTVTEPVETVAPYTCARSLLEAAALACWILDPEIDARARISRSLALRYKGMTQQMKWARSVGLDPIRARRRLEELVALAANLEYAPVKDSRGRSCGAGQPMPSVTNVIAEMLDEEGLYRLLSAVAHGHHWALQQLSFEKAAHFDTLVTTSGVKLTGLTKATNVVGLASIVLAAAAAFARVAWYQATYLGWDQAKVRTVLDRHFDHLGAADDLRFWHAAS